MASSLSFARLFADSAGDSHFAPVEIGITTQNFAPPAPSFSVSDLMPSSRCGFLQLPHRWAGDLHPSPMRMWIFILMGEMEFEASDGERRHLSPGSAMLLEDTTGKGHRSRVAGDTQAVLAVVQL